MITTPILSNLAPFRDTFPSIPLSVYHRVMLSTDEKASGLYTVASKENDVGVKIVSTDDDELAAAEKHILGEHEYTPAEYKKLVRKVDL